MIFTKIRNLELIFKANLQSFFLVLKLNSHKKADNARFIIKLF
jgi:hypothetical protein